jgi:hypothetical protein
VLLPLLGLIGGRDPRRRARRARLALPTALFVGTVGGYGLFFYHGVIYGPRFYYLAWPLALLASAAAIRRARPGGRLPGAPWAAGRRRAGRGAAGAPGGRDSIAAWPAVKQHAGRRPRTGDGALVAALDDPKLRDALVFVDSMTLPATVTFDPVHLDAQPPAGGEDLGDAADAGFARLFPRRRPLRMQGKQLRAADVVAPDAPMRHEGGALYPARRRPRRLRRSRHRPGVGNVELSAGAALRFAVDAGRRAFSLPVWVIAADAGPMTRRRWRWSDHPGSPAIDVTSTASWSRPAWSTTAPGWTLVERIELAADADSGAPSRRRSPMPTGPRKGRCSRSTHVELRAAAVGRTERDGGRDRGGDRGGGRDRGRSTVNARTATRDRVAAGRRARRAARPARSARRARSNSSRGSVARS